MAKTTHPLHQAFTLIELLVVISIIAIIIGISSFSYLTVQKQTRDAKRKADLEQIRQALETYRSENGVYPSTTTTLTPDYLTTLPTDPKGGSYVYQPGSSPITNYSLCAYLELGSGTTNCTTACGPSGQTCNYEVNNP